MDEFESKITEAIRRPAADDQARSDHRYALRREALDKFDAAQAGLARRNRVLSFLLHDINWRSVMSHPVSRWSAAAAFVLAIAIAGWFVMEGSTTSALANFAEPIINAKSAKFKLTARAGGQVVAVSNLLVHGTRMRMETEQPGSGRKQIDIRNEESGRSLTLLPNEKKAEVILIQNRPEKMKTGGFLAEIRKMLIESETSANTIREALGEREVDGRRLVGYRISNPAMKLEIWGDPATGLPHSIDQTMSAYPSMTTTMTNFEFDMPFDETLLSLDPPQGYQVSERSVDVTPPSEADLIAALRVTAELNGRVFPDDLNMEVGYKLAKEASEETKILIQRGFGFLMPLPADKRQYLGKGVRLNTPNQPIFWYHPEGKDVFRIIYADLTTADAERKPEVKQPQ